MTRFSNVVLGGLAALAIGGTAASSALAEESGSFQNRLSAATIGLPNGAQPPPGLYTGLETAYLGLPMSLPSTGSFLAAPGVPAGGVRVSLPAIAQAVPLLYVPGWNFLGASYAMAVVQAWYVNHGCIASNCSNGMFGFGNQDNMFSGGGFVTANTTINPISLSWNGNNWGWNGWFVGVAFNFMPPDGTRSNLSTGQITPNPDYWTFEPALAISYLSPTWNISGNFYYDINTVSRGNCCSGFNLAGNPLGLNETSGNLFYIDAHALYKVGKWSFGPVGALEVQTTNATGTACTSTTPFGPGAVPVNASGFCNRFGYAQLGGLVGYDFGPVDLQVWLTDAVWSQNAAGAAGTIEIYSRLSFRLWAPEAAHPLVTKN
jgi:hypothetical protein